MHRGTHTTSGIRLFWCVRGSALSQHARLSADRRVCADIASMARGLVDRCLWVQGYCGDPVCSDTHKLCMHPLHMVHMCSVLL